METFDTIEDNLYDFEEKYNSEMRSIVAQAHDDDDEKDYLECE